MLIDLILYALGFIGVGIIISAPVAFKIGKRQAERECAPAWDHVADIHQQLGHKSYILLNPQIAPRRAK